MVCDKDTAAMFEAEVEHGATEHVTIYKGTPIDHEGQEKGAYGK